MSHTITTKVQYTCPASAEAPLAKAIVKMGGQLLGEGKHKLYGSEETGYGFRLPGWRHPLVLKNNGELLFDDYHGSWGNVADLNKLKEFYSIETARAVAEQFGWLVQDAENGAIDVYHPTGGKVTISPNGTIDANGFVGQSCDLATNPFVQALGGKDLETLKSEYFVECANVQQQGAAE